MNQKLASFAIVFISSLLLVPQVRAAVLINEIAPKYADPAWEWVELYNTDASSVSLDRWRLDHTAGDGKSYTLNASAIIEPHGFLTLSTSQTAIVYGIEGDTVRLFDANGALADSKSYPGTLGYNTAMGRSTDGGDGWVICSPEPYAATPNKANNCPPAPTATPTPAATVTPVPTPTPTKAPPMPTPTLAPQSFGSLMATPTPPQVLGQSQTVIPTPTPSEDIFQVAIAKSWIAYALLAVAAGAASLMLTLWLKRRRLPPKSE